MYTYIYIYIYIHYITLHYITLHYITLHYITLHTYIHMGPNFGSRTGQFQIFSHQMEMR